MLFFFDVYNDGMPKKDDTGTELADLDAARAAALQLLPELVREELLMTECHQSFGVRVTGKDGQAIYAATLNFTGRWLRH